MALSATVRFDLLAPSLASNPNKASYIEMATEQTAPVSAYGFDSAKRNQAIALRAAHMLTLATSPAYVGGASGGAVSSKSEGSLSVSYATTASERDADLSQTVFGRQLLELGAGTMLRFGVLGGCG